MITTRQVRTDIIYILRPIFHEGVAKLLLGSYLRFRLYGAYVGLELLGNSLIVTFEVLGFIFHAYATHTKAMSTGELYQNCRDVEHRGPQGGLHGNGFSVDLAPSTRYVSGPRRKEVRSI